MSGPDRVTILALGEMKARGERIVMITAYDFPTASIVEEAGVDVVLVGDSAAMVVLGYDSTVVVSTEEMLVLTRAVRRGLSRPLLVGDLPFGSYEASDLEAITTARRFVKEAGCDAVKIERAGSSTQRARALVQAGIPVMGHLGLTPQTAASGGGYKSRARTSAEAHALERDAAELEEAGCFALVLEAIPRQVTESVAARAKIPVIGIGAGAGADGQVLVIHDIIGLHDGHVPRFVKRYAELRTVILDSVKQYVDDVRTQNYPAPEHEYSMSQQEDAAYNRVEESSK